MNHISEEVIQLLAASERPLNSEEENHLSNCLKCQAELELARLVITGVRQHPKPAFDFDISCSVLAELTLKEERTKRPFKPVIFISLLFIILAAVTIYVFRDSFLSLIGLAKQMFLYALLLAVVSIMSLLVIDMLRNYNKRMRMLESF